MVCVVRINYLVLLVNSMLAPYLKSMRRRQQFRKHADFAKWPRQKSDAVVEFVKTMESAGDVGRMTGMVTG